jgi:hypothetical protein
MDKRPTLLRGTVQRLARCPNVLPNRLIPCSWQRSQTSLLSCAAKKVVQAGEQGEGGVVQSGMGPKRRRSEEVNRGSQQQEDVNEDNGETRGRMTGGGGAEQFYVLQKIIGMLRRGDRMR